MKRTILTAILACSMAPAAALADVDLKVTLGEPEYFGPIEIAEFPEPRLLYREPVIVRQVDVEPDPIYLRVPPGHAKHWDKHCDDYGACNRQVFFVDSDWYETIYAPEYRRLHGHPGKGPKK